MSMDTVELVYYVCFFLGFGFAVVSGLLSGLFSGGAEAHVDAGGAHGHAGSGHHDGTVHFSPLSPVVLSMFIASFGGAGLIFKKVLAWPTVAHMPVAAVSGVVVAGVVFLLFYKIFEVAQSSSEAHADDAVGMEAEVTVPIPHQGLGEIAYTLSETRLTNPARTADGKELPAHTKVKIVDLVGGTYIVQKS
jgi:membrane protein implicated in regulation of membrane protease activity